ncbi:MAG: tRNA 2-thiouridine(34) synthase MnmA [Thiohalospira sp.]
MVGLSGGVDSSVAAARLLAAGHDVQGIFMRNWAPATGEPCPAEQDYADARAVARALELPLSGIDFAAEYRERVFARFLAEYRAGRTPNPDILCNTEIKFGTFLTHARSQGAGAVATGHYARRRYRDGRWQLLRAVDTGKDQTYFLHALDQEQLAAARFPLGELTKDEVRAEATRLGLATADKRDSTGICFIGEQDFREFLGRYLATAPGPMVTPEGDRVGEHQGLAFYTLGQRQGLGLGGVRGYPDRPWFVVGKAPGENTLIVAQGGDHPWLMSRELTASGLHWIAGEAPELPRRCTVRTRYRQPDRPATIDAAGERLTVRFDEPERAVTPGQAVVLYDGEVCLGGATIDTTDAPGVLAGE